MKQSIIAGALGAFFCTLSATPAFARDDSQLWTSAGVNVKLDDHWRIGQELTGRFSDNRNGLYEIESVTMLGYKFSKTATFSAGYVFNPLYSSGDLTAREHRLREQISFDNFTQIGRGKLSARLRLEQRWREHQDGTAWRMRPYVKFSLPLRAGGKTALVLSNETFVNLKATDFQRTKGIDRMRNLVAINTPLAKNLNLEAGYLNQYGFVRHGDDTVDHVGSVSLSLSL
jgi:hypothetical protein